ncbi:hypothetical protein [Ornithinimicrobium kibberense]|uniref:hypothetical protein n=1 Tax=Ornithinimicrobium kibberense TaxID=282060 RepID=UPI0036062E95
MTAMVLGRLRLGQSAADAVEEVRWRLDHVQAWLLQVLCCADGAQARDTPQRFRTVHDTPGRGGGIAAADETPGRDEARPPRRRAGLPTTGRPGAGLRRWSRRRAPWWPGPATGGAPRPGRPSSPRRATRSPRPGPRRPGAARCRPGRSPAGPAGAARPGAPSCRHRP